ncbi:MAG: SAM-dependent methyltransferase [Chitinophagales bacterium]
MLELTKDYWNKRYLNGETQWDIGYISEPFKHYFDQLTNKNLHILVPGAGNAHEVEYLFVNGFKNVFLLDWSLKALQNFQSRIPDFPVSQLINADFFQHEGQYDLMIEQTFFCALNPSLRKKYAQHSHQLLKNEGKIVGLLFNIPLNDDHPPFGGKKEEYISYFEDYFNIQIMEPCYNSILPRANSELFVKMVKK